MDRASFFSRETRDRPQHDSQQGFFTSRGGYGTLFVADFRLPSGDERANFFARANVAALAS